MNNDEIASCCDIEKLLRMRDQAQELMGLARQDGDGADATRWAKKSEAINQRIKVIRSKQ